MMMCKEGEEESEAEEMRCFTEETGWRRMETDAKKTCKTKAEEAEALLYFVRALLRYGCNGIT